VDESVLLVSLHHATSATTDKTFTYNTVTAVCDQSNNKSDSWQNLMPIDICITLEIKVL